MSFGQSILYISKHNNKHCKTTDAARKASLRMYSSVNVVLILELTPYEKRNGLELRMKIDFVKNYIFLNFFGL